MTKVARRHGLESTRARPGTAAAFASGAQARWLFVAILITLGLWAYSTSFSNAIIGDDDGAIAQNASIRSLWPLTAPLSPPADTTVAARPIANLTFAINYAFAGGTADLWGYHAFNLVVHLLTGLGLFGIVRRTLLTPRLRDSLGEASAPVAFVIAAIWLVHPLHTEAVTFLAQRVESLMGVFYVATLYCAIRAAESGFEDRVWIVAAVAACALGMGTKETMIGAPLIVTLWIWMCRPDVELFGEARPLVVGLAATMLIVAGLSLTGARSASAGFGVRGWTWSSYLLTQGEVIVHYLRLVFWPYPLVFQYAWLPAASWGAVFPQLALLASLAIATVVALARRMPVGLLGAWFFLILAPSSSIVPISTEVAAEHRMYLPLAAVVAGVVLIVQLVARKWSARLTPAWILLLLVVPLGLATRDRNRVYASAELMAEDVVAKRPQNPHARLAYGSFLVGAKRFAEAEPHLRAALTLPLPPSTDESKARSLAHMYLGMALVPQGRADEGVREFEQAIALRPDLDRAYALLAEAQLAQKRPRAALTTLEQALAHRPEDPALLKRAAWILAISSDDAIRNGAKAVQYAERSVTLTQGQDPVALDVLAVAYAEVGQFDNAMLALRRASEFVKSGGPDALITLFRGHLELFEAKRPVRSPDW